MYRCLHLVYTSVGIVLFLPFGQILRTSVYRWFRRSKKSCSKLISIEIDYPGSNNRTEFTLDHFGQNVKLVEVVGGSTTSTKQFVWSDCKRREERDGSGSLTKCFYAKGQYNAGTKYFYCKDMIGSVRELTDNTGNPIQISSFDPYGARSSSLQNVASDFTYAGYYSHERSALLLTLNRQYQPAFGVWLSRDPLEEEASAQLYGYVLNNPLGMTDELGLLPIPVPSSANLDKNIDEAQGHPWDLFWIANMVGNKKPWDYKQIHSMYEAFGNFNYGAIANAACIPLDLTLRAGGFAGQASKHGYFWPAAYWRAGIGQFPYGDQYTDSWWIIQGWYYGDNYLFQKTGKRQPERCCKK